MDFFLSAFYLGRNVRNRIGMLYQKLFLTLLILCWLDVVEMFIVPTVFVVSSESVWAI